MIFFPSFKEGRFLLIQLPYTDNFMTFRFRQVIEINGSQN